MGCKFGEFEFNSLSSSFLFFFTSQLVHILVLRLLLFQASPYSLTNVSPLAKNWNSICNRDTFWSADSFQLASFCSFAFLRILRETKFEFNSRLADKLKNFHSFLFSVLFSLANIEISFLKHSTRVPNIRKNVYPIFNRNNSAFFVMLKIFRFFC